MNTKIKTVDAYINQYPDKIAKRLKIVRKMVKTIVPNAVEKISYGMAGYKLNGRVLLYFAGFSNHVGVYPVTGKIQSSLKKELLGYKTGKGSVRFPHEKALPTGLIRKIIKLRLQENQSI